VWGVRLVKADRAALDRIGVDMPKITITICDLLREERNELLDVVAEELTRDPRPHLKKLLHDRLKGISKEMGDANCPSDPDEGRYKDLIRELEEGLL